MNHENRRKFLKNTSLLGGLGFANFSEGSTNHYFPIESQNGKLVITSHEKGQVIKPLDVVPIIASGRKEDGNYYNQEAQNLQERLDKLTRNGRHYVHFVPEDPQFFTKRNIGKPKPKNKFLCQIPIP